VGFLGFVTSPSGNVMELDHISTIDDWPTPESVQDMHELVSLTKFSGSSS
jgi:hypothetical protein